jgi:hypothetical protein
MHTDLESQAGLRRLLRALPEVTQQPYGYQEFEQRVLERERAARGASGGTRLLATAVIAVAVLAVLWRLTVLAPAPPSARGGAAGVPAAGNEPPESGRESDASTMEQERWLASLPREPALVHVGTRSAVMGLQDRIAQVDDLLNSERNARARPARLQALQQERARLVGTLVQVRYAETLADNVP